MLHIKNQSHRSIGSREEDVFFLVNQHYPIVELAVKRSRSTKGQGKHKVII